MRKKAAAFLLSATICMILAVPAWAEGDYNMHQQMNNVGQNNTVTEDVRDLRHDLKRDTIRTNSFDDTGVHRTNWGFLGLFGLLGLAGLMNRNRDPRR
ncbi:hypothetical protein GRF59_08160 [Paenibacillus sp. HJL G12]|uniref:WGxxGxxG-CTERM domain-containing protein n=2 Tax=Paenibacillus dendrobii TaxID=2691084 RepID=A0A7X3IGP2_9BACL|nr:hypothetical protein [Paenibacillus dendrobii]